MKCKMFPTLIRLVTSLACVFGFSALYGRAYGAAGISYEQGNYQVRYSYVSNYRASEYAGDTQYDPAQYLAVFPQSNFGYHGQYATRYAHAYSPQYGTYYNRLSKYNLRGFDSYGRHDYVTGNQSMQSRRYQRYFGYQSGKYATSLQASSYGNCGKDQDRRC